MKKVLSLVLVLTLVLGSFSFAFAAPASDVAGTEYEDAVARLMALEVLTGYPDGSFKPENTITRAEFAAAIVRVLGLDASAKASTGVSVFTDVPATHWASGYIALANKLGIVNGRGNGTFDPAAPVKYEEAVKMVMCALGYQPAAEKRGGYPIGYLSYANEEGITDGTNAMLNLPAPRGIVAILLDNALETPMLVQKGFGSLELFEKDPSQILLGKLGLTRVDGQVESVDKNYKEVVVKGKTYKVADNITVDGLDKLVVTLWIKSGKVVTLTINSDVKYDFVADVKTEGTELTAIKLTNANKEFRVNKNTTIAKTSAIKDQFVKVVLNNDNEIVAVKAYDLDGDAGLVKSADSKVLEYVRGTTTKRVRDLDEAKEIIVVINGKLAKYDDLAKDMFFQYEEFAAKRYIIVATDKTVEGELERANADEVRIDGEYYDLASTNYASKDDGEKYEATVADLLKKEVVAYLNNVGEVAYVRGDVEEKGTSFYGFIAKINDFDQKLRLVKVVDGELKTVTYDVSMKAADYGALKVNDFVKVTVNDKDVITKAIVPETKTYTSSEFNSKGNYIVAKNDGSSYNVYADEATIFDATKLDDIKLLTWKNIKGTTFDSKEITFKAGSLTPSVIVITDNDGVAFATESKTQYVGFVLGVYRVGSGKYEYDLQTSEGKVTYLVEQDADDVAEAGDAAVYEILSADDGKAKVVASAVYGKLNGAALGTFTTGKNIAESATAKYLTLKTGEVIRVASDVLVYKVTIEDGEAEYKLADSTDIEKGDQVFYALKEGQIKALFFQR